MGSDIRSERHSAEQKSQSAHVEEAQQTSYAQDVGHESLLDEDGLGVAQTLLKNPIIVLCALYGNIGALMYGFDNITLSLCLDMQPFVKQFGVLENGEYIIPAYWQSLWNAIPQLTTALGAWVSGPISDRLGRRWTMLIAGVLSIIGVTIVFTASVSAPFLVGKMVNSLGLGMALASGQTYISEITPTKIRGIALAVYTVCLSVGYLIAASVSLSRVTIMDQSSYKVVFAAEWIWPVLLVLGAFVVPESPYFLVRKNRIDSATKSLTMLHRSNTWIQVQARLKTMQDTIHREALTESAEASFRDCFKGTNWRRTRIVLYSNGLSQMTGATFINNSPYFMVLAGLSATNTAMMVEVGIAMSIFSSILTLWAMARVGRRPIVLSGIALAAVLFFIMGIAASVPTQSSASLWCVAITLQMVWLSIGPANGPALAIAAEVSSVRLRAKTLAIGFFFNYFYSTIWNVVVPYMFNPTEGNLGGLIGWIFFATSVVAFGIMWIELPETKDLSFEQIDRRFEEKVVTRGFTNSAIDPAISTKLDDIEMGDVENTEASGR